MILVLSRIGQLWNQFKCLIVYDSFAMVVILCLLSIKIVVKDVIRHLSLMSLAHETSGNNFQSYIFIISFIPLKSLYILLHSGYLHRERSSMVSG